MIRSLTSRVGRRFAATSCAPRWWSCERQRTRTTAGADKLLVFGRYRGMGSSSSPTQPSSSASSIAGENTKEFLVKVPDAQMASALNTEESGIRGQLITLTSVAAALYIGYFISPLVGKGTAGSAVRLLKSKDTLFQKTGLSRLRMIHKAGQPSYMTSAVENEGVETLLHLIVSAGGVGVSTAASAASAGAWRRKEKKSGAVDAGNTGENAIALGNGVKKKTEAREVAEEALACLMELGESEEVLELMAARNGLTEAVRAAARDKRLDKGVRAQLGMLHDKLLGVMRKAGGR